MGLGLRPAADTAAGMESVPAVLPIAEGVGLRKEKGVAMIATRLMPIFSAILIPHFMFADAAVIMIALFAAGLVIAGAFPSVIMGFRDLRAACADAFVGAVIHIRPGVGVRNFILSRVAARAGMVMDIPVYGPFGFPIVAQRVAVFPTADFAFNRGCAGGRAAMILPDIASTWRMCAIRIGA